MTTFYKTAGRLAAGLLGLGLVLGARPASAQAPAWGGAVFGNTNGTSSSSVIGSVATDASGNVFVTGLFLGTLVLGNTTLTSAGANDLFVAKYVPATGTWAWAASGGGTGQDYGNAIAVRGNAVYVTGFITNSTTNPANVRFGGSGTTAGAVQVNGASPVSSVDLVLARYTDNGSSAALDWTQVAGGTDVDQGLGVAVSGNAVYVTGFLTNNRNNANAVVLGGGGTTAGTVAQAGASPTASTDVLLAKYTDNGGSATLGWAQVAGGTSNDQGNGVAASSTSVYVAGTLANNRNNDLNVVFGGSGLVAGTVPQAGASPTGSADAVLAKYTDNGATATFRWSQVGGGTADDQGTAVAVSGSSVYLAGTITNTTANAQGVVFGGAGTTAGTSAQYGASPTADYDQVLAKYLDNGATASLGWTQVGGGSRRDIALGVAVSGSSVFTTGIIDGNSATTILFGGSGATAGTSAVSSVGPPSNFDAVLAKYTDNGATAAFGWGLAGGGSAFDYGRSVAIAGQQVYLGGYVQPAAVFGPSTVSTPAGTVTAVLARLTDATLAPLATLAAGGRGAGLVLYPNPALGAATLGGLAPGRAVQVLDALGRVVAAATATAAGTVPLPASLVPGVYVVRSAGQATRLVVE